MNDSLTALKVRAQLEKFLGVFSPQFSKPELNFLGDMLYGLQAEKDVRLSCIGRGLLEDIDPGKTEERLSRNLKREGLAEKIFDAVAKEGARHVGEDTIIAVDPTDIRKLYAKRMPFLATVRDGSADGLAKGYWCCAAVACEGGGRRITPLHLRLWSHEADGFVSENAEIFAAVDAVRAHAGKRGVYAVDRGGDREELYNHFLDNGLRFVVRLVGNRNLVSRKREILAERLALRCPMLYAETIRRETPEGERAYQIEYGSMRVRLPWRDEELRMVVVRGFGDRPMMLLTTLAAEDSRKALWQAVEGYLARWRVEDAIRFIKQSYRLESVRLLDYTRLRNMMAIVLAAAYFASAWLGRSLRKDILVGNITRVSRRLFGVAEFHYYAIADGIAALFRRYGKWAGKTATPEAPAHPELPLFFSSS